MALISGTSELPKHNKTIKVDARTWTQLNDIKKGNESFDDVLQKLLNQRTQNASTENFGLIRYRRKTAFIELEENINIQTSGRYLGIEFEYNDIKSEKEKFTIDLRIKKIFYGKRGYNPSIFFGVDHEHKHISEKYLEIYFRCILQVLKKEFGITESWVNNNLFNIVYWKKLYSTYYLSMDSFSNDIEDVLALSEEEKPTMDQQKNMSESTCNLIGLHK